MSTVPSPLVDPVLLGAFLAEHYIDTDAIGVGTTKTLTQLAGEIAAGESSLHVNDDGQVVRRTFGACVNVLYYTHGGERLRLVEDRQELANGLVRRREIFGFSIAEKLLAGEDPLAGARRALREELAIDEELEVRPDRLMTRLLWSGSYPGLRTDYQLWFYRVTLPDRWYRPEGYVEEQPDKRNVYLWVPDTD